MIPKDAKPLPAGCPWCGPLPDSHTTKICDKHKVAFMASYQSFLEARKEPPPVPSS